ncbi:MAG: hypothetical protein LBS53_07935 [Synergistaceae bacterium]|jgi:hypothetical protein|nr:hypothetical protein [Synergistaceae bacterium]
MVTENTHPRRDFDNLLKTALKHGFWDGLKLFLPALWEAADKNKPVEFLDKELQKVTFDLEGGANRLDMLARITLAKGGEEYILCHQEYQGEGGGDLPTRMFRYMAAIYLLHSKSPVGIAVVMGSRPNGEETYYHSDNYGVKVSYAYINYFVLNTDDEILLAGDNRVGLVLYAAKCAHRSGRDEDKKFRYLREISDIWAKRGWNPHDKRVILEAAEYLLNLTDENYVQRMIEYLENLQMNEGDREMYKSIFERVYGERGRERGREEGRLEGRQAGRQEGRQEKALEMAQNLLAEGISPDVIAKTSGLSRNEIQSLVNG